MTTKLLLIDGDQFLYEVTSANEVEVDWGDDVWTLTNDLKVCKTSLESRIEGVKKRFNTPDFLFCLSDDVNFRKGVLPSYKAKRKTVRKPVGYKALKEWAEAQFPCKALPSLEADDVMGVLATSLPNTVIISEDKDMKTIPGTLFRQGEVKTYTVAEADYWFLYQTLCGDITDGYKGCPGIGDKTAQKILGPLETFDVKEAWERVITAYEKAGLDYTDAVQQARCARILRSTEFDQATKSIHFWKP